ncbi:MAG: DNA polymerase I [Oscillospiraceae bacterium]|nr:DNA polymerase I [Oscillospiraceae bacterium]
MKIMVIDGNSIVNRAFYGVRPLTNAEGLNTNAIYGFLSIYFKILEEVKPDGVCVAFDLKKPTFRHLKYEGYKANRKGMPDELAEQMQPLKEVLDAMNLLRMECEGFEADDIIGTVSRICKDNGDECVIVTGDRDSFQLIENEGTNVLLVSSKMGRTETTLYNGAELLMKYGLPAELMRDLKALMGDASDNIPGVSGIGEKTALELVSRFGDIDKIYENIDSPDIREAVRKKLLAGRESAYLSKWLGTIAQDAPIEFAASLALLRDFDNDKLYKLFARLEFKSFITRFSLHAPEIADESAAMEQKKLLRVFVKSEAELEKIKSALSGKACAVYVNEGLSAISVSDGERVFSVALCDVAENSFRDFLRFVFSDAVRKTVHNKKSLREKLRGEGIELSGVEFDTALAAYVSDPARKRYDIVSVSHMFGLDLDAAYERSEDETNFSPLTGSEAGLSAVSDICEAMTTLYDEMIKKLRADGEEGLYFDIEMPLCDVLSDMEEAGIKVDRKELESFGEVLSNQIEALENEIYSIAGEKFNILSPKQLGEILFEKLGIPPIKKTKTGYSTDAEVLEKLCHRHDIIPPILEYRKYAKLKSTYADGLVRFISEKDGRIHTTFQQMVTATGRISSTDPNLQNIPIRSELGGEVRKMFIPENEEMCFIDADYSQIELRVLAHITGDEEMCRAFRNGEDVHTRTASEVFGVPADEVTGEMRRVSKAVNFGIVYGISEFSLADDIGVSRAEAKRYMEAYFAHFSGVQAYMKEIVECARRDGYVTTMFGRRRYIPEISSKNFNIRSFGERVALNAPIQGSAADIIKIAMIRVAKRLRESGLSARLVLQVHDELIVESSKKDAQSAAKILREEMENACSLSVPLCADAGIGETWYDAKK